jgi:FkbM family methyltransferase
MREPFLEAGLWWPAGCRGKVDRYLRHRKDSDVARKLCRRGAKVCVQAGAHNGLWAMHLTKHFGRVVTFEPEAANWECLQRNLGDRFPRIEAHHAMLGESAGMGTVMVNGKNTGGHKVRYDGGATPVIAIDALGLEDVGLIYLDIEGAEWPALKGAVRTISRCRPVIAYESRDHTVHFGYEPGDLAKWLTQAGYRQVRKVSRDLIWTPR